MWMRPSHGISVALLSAALSVALPANAQMYKWVDERGVVSYSNSPPPSAGKSGKVDVIEERVTVYTPDPLLNRAIAEEAANARDGKASKRKRDQEAERRASASASKTADDAQDKRKQQLQTAYEQCMADRRVECDTILSGNPSPASYGFNGLPQYVVVPRVAAAPRKPFYVDDTPPPRVGVSTAPKVGIDNRPPVGAPPPSRPVGNFR